MPTTSSLTASEAAVSSPEASTPPGKPEKPWRRQMKLAMRDPVVLCQHLQLPEAYQAAAQRAARDFPLFVPLGYVAKMRLGDPHDPLLRQVLPLEDELQHIPGFVADPVGDLVAKRSPGMLQKYAGRVLIVSTGACAIHCRYCFRRHYPYSEGPRSLNEWQPVLNQIAGDSSIDEVLLSGGDPLTLVDESLAALANELATISHVKRLRIHTRLPIVIPERVDQDLLTWLTGTRLTPIVVVHANHPREVDRNVADAFTRLVEAGVPVLNQAVLLRGVNDDADTLIELCRQLVDLRVMPYYLHQLDRVAGAAHFDVPIARGLEIMAVMRSQLPGYALPRYVREMPGGTSKEEIVGPLELRPTI